MSVSVVIPTIGRASLAPLLQSLLRGRGPRPEQILVVVDRARQGPAATRNSGWRAATGQWVAFLDDDVLPEPDWLARLATDLDVPADVAGVQGVVHVPLPADRPPTDWERTTAGLAGAPWITADMAYRRSVLAEVGGFDERFPRAYREDSELAIRVRARGHRLVVGERRVTHPVRPAHPLSSVLTQRGNADDALLRRLYGRDWRRLAGAPAGRRTRHALVTAAGAAAAVLALSGHRVPAAAAALAWTAGTVEFAAARGRPRWAAALTSAVIPPLAVYYWLRGWFAYRGARPKLAYSNGHASLGGHGSDAGRPGGAGLQSGGGAVGYAAAG